MSGNKKEKALARERMARTGENYTAALAAVRREAPRAGKTTQALTRAARETLPAAHIIDVIDR